jgi:hypothetical protein
MASAARAAAGTWRKSPTTNAASIFIVTLLTAFALLGFSAILVIRMNWLSVERRFL